MQQKYTRCCRPKLLFGQDTAQIKFLQPFKDFAASSQMGFLWPQTSVNPRPSDLRRLTAQNASFVRLQHLRCVRTRHTCRNNAHLLSEHGVVGKIH